MQKTVRGKRLMRFVLVFWVIVAAVGFGAWLPGHLLSHENERGMAVVPIREKEDVQKLTEEIQRLRKARYELILADLNNCGVSQPLLPEGDPRNPKVLGPNCLEVMAVFTRRCVGALLDYADDPKLRHDLLVRHLNDAKKWEEYAQARLKKQSRDWGPGELQSVQLLRMEIEIEMLKAKRAEATGRY
jgi:hypothetical protein